MKFVVVLLATGVAAFAQSNSATKAQSDQFEQKVQQIAAHANNEPSVARRTTVTEAEVNAYLRIKGPDILPVGVTDATVAAEGAGRVSGRAIVDLDVVREKKSSGSLLDLTTYLTGRLPVQASGVLHTQDGRARFELRSAEVSGVPIPKAFLQELVAYYTRSSEFPNGVSLDQAYDLPANIREIQIGEGSAIVVQ